MGLKNIYLFTSYGVLNFVYICVCDLLSKISYRHFIALDHFIKNKKINLKYSKYKKKLIFFSKQAEWKLVHQINLKKNRNISFLLTITISPV